ncbi:hypothetical protein BN13_310004 [Nostocoides jenkinsii Ben 74]|uniref:Uncharacterized protein n=1 Tax=Nostocoides jenkinsii Ben 74 TaxID=1193518 RepID=A0A077M7D6_9MICO|nr:hypothetical protein BN13_310004 [Tetrasphaera jenkinsii Ben 74]
MRVVVVPSPTCPEVFEPQHLAARAEVRVQAWFSPAVNWTAPPAPDTTLGVTAYRKPQHLTALVGVTAQLKAPPAVIAFAPDVRPTTWTGVERLILVPSPS